MVSSFYTCESCKNCIHNDHISQCYFCSSLSLNNTVLCKDCMKEDNKIDLKNGKILMVCDNCIKTDHDLMYDKYRLYKKRFDNLECIELKNIIEKH